MNMNLLNNKRYIFWDFDGVIKDSVEIKSNAYEDLFLQWGELVSDKVRDHHRLNGGMSRFDKIPLYLRKLGFYWSFHNSFIVILNYTSS